MADRKNPFTEIGFPEYTGIHRMPFALKDRAVMHETNRQRVIASIILDLHFMAVLNIIKAGEPISLGKAVAQNLKGTDQDTTEAAHCAPRQLLVGTQSPQELLQAVIPERAWVLSVLFGETDILPDNFNKCDSRAERRGLDRAFRHACQYAIEAGHQDAQLEINKIIVKAERAYAIYKDGATVAFRESAERLKIKLKPKFLFPKEEAKLTEQLQITEQYAETVRESPGKTQGISLWKIEGLIKIYKLL